MENTRSHLIFTLLIAICYFPAPLSPISDPHCYVVKINIKCYCKERKHHITERAGGRVINYGKKDDESAKSIR